MVKHDEIQKALNDRSSWEKKQATWYKMRNDGLRRVNKPWPNASDLHYPLADQMIEKLKPIFVSQIFAGDTIASFVGLDTASIQFQTAAAQWFDDQLKQRSNFEEEMTFGVDIMLERGKSPVKVFWDAEKEQLTFEAIEPHDLIVPTTTGRLQEADWIVHRQFYSPAAYKRLKCFATDKETIDKISGASQTSAQASDYVTARENREGLKQTQQGKIEIWELYYRKEETGAWWVHTYSPNAPDLALRPDFGLPYNKGVFQKSAPPPFGELTNELKRRGYYDSRSVPERVAAFEASLCKDWNTQKDYQTYSNAPVFAPANGATIPSTANLKFIPGQILPYAVQAVTMPPPPIDIVQSMQGTRMIAEQLAAIPDLGMASSGDATRGRTAKEVSLIAGVMGQTSDLRSRGVRREIAHILNLAYSILIQYRAEARDYFFLDELMELPDAALEGKYRIQPNGSGDNYNRGAVVQQAQNRFQMLNNDPFIDQGELRKDLLNAADPRLTKKLFKDAGTAASEQQEDQAQEITIMLLGFPAQVRPTDDDAAHLQSIQGFATRRMQQREPITPEQLALILQHAQGHAQKLQQTNKPKWQQVAPMVTPFLEQMQAMLQQMIAAQKAQAGAAPGGMPPGAPGLPPAPPAQPAAPQGPATLQPGPAQPLPTLMPQGV